MPIISDVQVLTKYKLKNNVKHLEKVLKKLTESALEVKAKKYLFRQTETEYLGFWASNQGVRSLFSKFDFIKKIDVPNKVREKAGFWG